MKSKLVFWGTNGADERVLIAMQLRAEDNKVDVYTFPASIVTEAFVQEMMNDWRNDKEVAFPEGHQKIERELSVTGSILPDDYKVERGDIVSRAQTEWHFAVLSTKLNQAYQAELDELKERVGKLSSFESEVWESLKAFWGKVQGQVRERNLFRQHADELRNQTNELFGTMKEMRSTMNEEFRKKSVEVASQFSKSLDEVEGKIKDGKAFKSIFEELKKIQREFKDANITRDHRNKIWKRIDNAFKAAKEMRFGSDGQNQGAANGNSALGRTQNRLKGLEEVIARMQKSIKRDQSDLDFQKKRIDRTDGQLEAQIRQAKLAMIQDRLESKQEKLKGMLETEAMLKDKIEQLQKKEAEAKAKAEAREAAKEKIAEKVKANEEKMEAMSSKLEKAAEKMQPKAAAATKKDDSLLGAIGTMLGESFEDVIDTVKAISEVVEEKIEEAIDDFKSDMSPAADKTEVEPKAAASTAADEEE